MPKNFAPKTPLYFGKKYTQGLPTESSRYFGEMYVKELRTENTNLFLRKLLKFQETFPEKFLVSGFGADAPTHFAPKSTALPCFFILRLVSLIENFPFDDSGGNGGIKRLRSLSHRYYYAATANISYAV